MQTNQIAFGSAIKINSYTNYPKAARVDGYTKNVINTLYKYIDIPCIEKKPVYNEKETKKIGDFLRKQIGDFSYKTGLFLRKINGCLFLFTGEEVKKVQKADEKLVKKLNNLQKECDAIKNKQEPTPKKAEKKAQRRYEIKSKSLREIKDKKLLEIIQEARPQKEITLKMDSNGKLQQIECHAGENKPAILSSKEIYG